MTIPAYGVIKDDPLYSVSPRPAPAGLILDFALSAVLLPLVADLRRKVEQVELNALGKISQWRWKDARFVQPLDPWIEAAHFGADVQRVVAYG